MESIPFSSSCNSFIPLEIVNKIFVDYCDLTSLLIFAQTSKYWYNFIHVISMDSKGIEKDQYKDENCVHLNWNDLYQRDVARFYPLWLRFDTDRMAKRMKEGQYKGNLDKIRQSMWKECYLSRKKPRNINDFQWICNIGEDTSGRLYLVQQKTTNEYYTIKIILKNENTSVQNEIDVIKYLNGIMEGVESFGNVSRNLAHLKSPYVIQYLDAFQDKKHLFIITEYLNGGDLFNLITLNEKLSVEMCKFLMCQMILAVEYCHKKMVIHRSLRPECFWLDHQGHIRVTGFELSKKLKKNEKRFSKCGVPDYAPPEILQGKGYDFSCDIWSLGVSFFGLLNGFLPFTGESYRLLFENIINRDVEFPSSLSPNLRDLLSKMLEKSPTKRLNISQIKSHAFFNGIDWAMCHKSNPPEHFQFGLKDDQDISQISKFHDPFYQSNLRDLLSTKTIQDEEIIMIHGVRCCQEQVLNSKNNSNQ